MVDTVLCEVPSQKLLVHGDAVGDRAAGEVGVEPVHMVSRVSHAGVQPKRLGDVDDSFFIDAEGNRIGQKRLGRELLDGEPARYTERPDGLLPLVRRRGKKGIVLREPAHRSSWPCHRHRHGPAAAEPERLKNTISGQKSFLCTLPVSREDRGGDRNNRHRRRDSRFIDRLTRAGNDVIIFRIRWIHAGWEVKSEFVRNKDDER